MIYYPVLFKIWNLHRIYYCVENLILLGQIIGSLILCTRLSTKLFIVQSTQSTSEIVIRLVNDVHILIKYEASAPTDLLKVCYSWLILINKSTYITSRYGCDSGPDALRYVSGEHIKKYAGFYL